VLSAAGLLAAPIEHELSIAFPRPLADASEVALRRALDGLDAGCARLMDAEGAAAKTRTIRHFADVCYIGQGYHLEIPIQNEGPHGDPDLLGRLYRDFLVAHDRVYGHATEAPARIVNLRAVHRSPQAPPPPVAAIAVQPGRQKALRQVLIDPSSGPEIAAVYDRASLASGQEFAGPAIVEQSDTTVLLPRGWRCRVEGNGCLELEPAVLPR
jgi:N-methylhydantoinase A/oxoprolinase/acetone carboxylase beta subunit